MEAFGRCGYWKAAPLAPFAYTGINCHEKPTDTTSASAVTPAGSSTPVPRAGGEPSYELSEGHHCHGTSITRWASGEDAGYGSDAYTDVAECNRVCDAHAECAGFLVGWGKCSYWKSGPLSPAAVKADIDCYQKPASRRRLASVTSSAVTARKHTVRLPLLSATMMSTAMWAGHNLSAPNCIDGLAGPPLATFCLSRLNDTSPWLSVQLAPAAAAVGVSHVLVHGRSDCCHNLLSPFEIWVAHAAGDPVANGGVACGPPVILPETATSGPFTVACAGHSGTHVTLRLPGTQRTLNIEDIEVFGQRDRESER